MMGHLLLLAIALSLWIYIGTQFTAPPWRQMQRDLGYAFRRRGSNPPPPGRKPAPPAGPPEQPLTAQLIRYWAWEQEQVRRAWLDPCLGEPWPEDRQPAPPAGQAAPTLRSAVEQLLEATAGLGDVDDAVRFARAALDADEIRLDEGSMQRGNGNGGPANPKPPAGPPSYGWGPRQLNPPPPAPGMRRKWLWSPSQMAECGGPCWEAQDPCRCDCGALWRDVPISFDEGPTQRGNSNGGPATPKPPAKPQPTGGHLIREGRLWGGYQPRPQGGTPNPPPSEP